MGNAERFGQSRNKAFQGCGPHKLSVSTIMAQNGGFAGLHVNSNTWSSAPSFFIIRLVIPETRSIRPSPAPRSDSPPNTTTFCVSSVSEKVSGVVPIVVVTSPPSTSTAKDAPIGVPLEDWSPLSTRIVPRQVRVILSAEQQTPKVRTVRPRANIAPLCVSLIETY